MLLANRKKGWKFNQSPLFLEFLMGWGGREYECTPWGNPTFNIFGWQKPCYLLQDGYVETFKELIETTEWERYGRASGNKACQQCMVHCGYEPSAVNHTFGSIGGLFGTVKAMLRGSYTDRAAAAALAEESKRPHGPLVQLGVSVKSREPAKAANAA
jgi:hypothetical protein